MCTVCTVCTVCTKCAQNALSVHSRRELCAVCTLYAKLQNMHQCAQSDVDFENIDFLCTLGLNQGLGILNPSQSALEACAVL